MKKIASSILFAALGGAITLAVYLLFIDKPQVFNGGSDVAKASIVTTGYGGSLTNAAENTDFTVAAEKSLNSVVHVKNTKFKTYRDPFAEFFYGQGSGTKQYSQVGTGSGVIISSDGYIITNNHVINEATDIEITLNNKKVYKAKLIGSDPTNDIALIKIDAEDLPYIVFGDSNSIKVGEWVLAVGNPYNLTSTVTAGIVSAKGRDLDGNSNIDSFIQTDAAVNSGNSGGALVNSKGELIGINTAISSSTGSFIGYSFAIPSNIAKKVIEDLMEFGNVQRANLGIMGGELNSKIAEELKIENTEGFFVSDVTKKSGAEKAGIKPNDIIIKLNNEKIRTYADLTGFLRTKRPNDEVSVTYLRDGKLKTANVTLTKNEMSSVKELGLELKNIDLKELKALKIANGVKIVAITNSELEHYGVRNGFIIISINDVNVNSVDDVDNMIATKKESEVLRIVIRNLKGEVERYIFR